MSNLPPNANTLPIGATIVPSGVVFRTWAPRAKQVYVIGEFSAWQPTKAGLLNPLDDGTWAGVIPGMGADAHYQFHVIGPGSPGPKRDPRARLLSFEPPFPNCHCLVRDPSTFPWHTTGWHAPQFNDLVLYQLHVGTFRIAAGAKDGRFLDVALQLPYFAALGINALQLLPVVEFETEFGQGYNGCDYFSPENQYGVEAPNDLQDYLQKINALFAQRGQPGYADGSAITGPDNQLRALIDLCHAWGVAVLFDVVYNHAGGFKDDDLSLYFFDRMPQGNNNDSLYFTDQGWAGGLIFAYWNQWVRQFLIDHATACYHEYRIDGLRFDEVTVMAAHGGWQTCQNINDTLHYINPSAITIAEFWGDKAAAVRPSSAGGAGFHAAWQDELRNAVRAAIAQASGGGSAAVDMDAVGRAIQSFTLPNQWRAINCVENHDIVKSQDGSGPRIPRLADPSDARSWYARSRSRVAAGLLLTAPGIPMLFMGQEILEDKLWNDNPSAGLMPWRAGLESGDRSMVDYHHFISDLIALRNNQPALRCEMVRAYHVHDANRVIAIHRWLEGIGRDIIIAATLNDQTWWNYQLGFPSGGRWLEIFNSDTYDNWVNPWTAGNGGQIWAGGPPMDDMPASGTVVIPANGFCIFAQG